MGEGKDAILKECPFRVGPGATARDQGGSSLSAAPDKLLGKKPPAFAPAGQGARTCPFGRALTRPRRRVAAFFFSQRGLRLCRCGALLYPEWDILNGKVCASQNCRVRPMSSLKQ